MNRAVQLPDEVEPIGDLLLALNAGEWLSASTIRSRFGLEPRAIIERIESLRGMGIDVRSDSERGYQLGSPVEFLQPSAIRRRLSPASRAELSQLLLYRSVDSTNTLLAGYQDGATRACLAEYQTAGRGRAGRSWLSSFAAGLHLSVGRDLAVPLAGLPAINLAIGVSVVESLLVLGVRGVGLKWPNDLWIGTAKLGGILAESTGVPGHRTRLVVGVGLNIDMPPSAGEGITQPWTRLVDHVADRPSRNRVAGCCLDAVLAALREFERDGFEPFMRRWESHDLIAGRVVDLLDGGRRRTGFARGVAPDGGLLVDINGTLETVYASDVSLRVPKTVG